jgi:hypothetical protein
MELLPQEPFNPPTHFVFMTIIKISGMLFSNQMSQSPITSNRGNKYVVIFYIYDDNFVKSVPIKSQSKEELLQAYRLVYAYLTAWGFKLQLHKMDNEMSHDVETFIPEESTRLQYTPSDIHRTNSAKRGICTPLRHCWASKDLSNHKLVSSHQPNRLHPQHATAMPSKSCYISIQGTQRVLYV